MVIAIMAILIGGSLGGLFVLGFARSIVPTLRAIRRGATAEGKVVASKAERGRYRTVYRPIVRFETPDGQHVEYQDVLAVPGDFRVDNAVTVHYDPRRPKVSATISDADRALATTLMMAGLVVFMVGIFVLGILMIVHVIPAPAM